jgi:YHS domain-containing protein
VGRRGRPGAAGFAGNFAAGKECGAVGILVRILRFIFWLIILSWLIWLVRRLFAQAKRATAERAQPVSPESRGRLFRDPVCGTHIPGEISLQLHESGHVHHFCSPECREKFAATRSRAASA